MTEYTVESRILPDGQWVRSERKLGTVYWSESSLHILRNVGKTTSHTIRVELKDLGLRRDFVRSTRLFSYTSPTVRLLIGKSDC